MSIFDLKKSATAKFVSVFIGGAMALTFVFGGAIAPAQAQTVEELTAQINSLLTMIATLQSQLSVMGGSTTGVSSYTFTKDLSQGDSGVDVLNLQKILNIDPATRLGTAPDLGSPGYETDYFGVRTKAAVIKFQNKYTAEILTPVGLTAGTGYFGPSTRAKINSMTFGSPTTPVTYPAGCTSTVGYSSTTGLACNGTSTGTPPVVTPAGTGLTVTSASQPTATLAPGGAARVPFTKVTLTASSDGDVVVDSIKIEKYGLVQDAAFAGVVLLDEDGTQIGIAKTLNSLHQATVGDAFTVKAGTSKTVTIAGNMTTKALMATYTGEVGGLSVVAVNTSATVNGSLPIVGTSHTMNSSLVLGTATADRGIDDPNTSATKEVGVSDYTFAAIKVTAGSAEKIRVHSLRWNQSGSASASDLENLKTYVDGVAYDMMTVSSDGKYYTANFGEGLVIDKGLSKQISVKGDIAGGSGRNIVFDVYKTTDLYVTGETYGYGITPEAGSTDTASTATSQFTTTTPWFDNCHVTVSDGTLTVSKATSVEAQNVAEVVSNQVLGGFDVEVKGEAISVASIVFTGTIAGSAGGVGTDIDNVTLVDANGSVVAGPVNATGASTSVTVTFTDTVTFPIGKGTYTLKGQLASAFVHDQTIVFATDPDDNWTTVTGQTTGNAITPAPTGAVTSNTMTVKAGSAVIYTSATPIASNVVAGAQNVLFANFQIDATASGEDVRFTSLVLNNTASAESEYQTGCQLWDGSTALNTGSNIKDIAAGGTASQTFTLDSGGVTVPKGTVKTLALKCNLSASADGQTYLWKMSAAQSGTGLSSGTTITVAAANVTGSGQTMTATTKGTLTVALDNASPAYKIVAGGSTNVELAKFKLSATNEDVTLKKLALQLTDAYSTNTDFVNQRVTVWDGTTQIGYASFGSDNFATSTIDQTVVIPKDDFKVLTVKGDLSKIKTTTEIGTQGALLKVNYDDDDPTGTQGVGAQSGQTINRTSSADTTVAGVRMFRAYPVFAKINLSTSERTLTSGATVPLYKFSVTAVDADGTSDGIGIHQFVLNTATSSDNLISGSTSLTNLKVYAYTDSAFSTTVDTSADGTAYTGGLVVANIAQVPGDAGSDTELQLSSPIRIPAGQTYYFKVVGVGTIVAGSGTVANNYIKTYIQGDTAFPVLYGEQIMASTTPLDLETDDDFIWSPFASSTIGINAIDWTNGYKVVGLPAAGMEAETISQ